MIYAGAAPSMKMSFLMKLFPNVIFIMVDPNEFFIYERYGLPHYVRQDNRYIEDGAKWGIFPDRAEREANAEDYVYLGYSNSNMYEGPEYKQKNILWYNTDTGKLESSSKPFIDSGKGKSAKHINEHIGEFNIHKRANQASFDYVFSSINSSEKSSNLSSDKLRHRVFFVEEYFTNDIAQMIAKSAAALS